jgi:hypothetical protein
MKRHFNLFDALFILFLYFKLSETGPELNWLTIFAPYLAEWLFILWAAMDKTFGWSDRVAYSFWKLALKWRIKMNARQARREANKP